MSAVEVFALFLVSHVVGDFLLQTDHQAMRKHGGLGRDPVARRALFAHLTTYVLAFSPGLLWLTREMDVWEVGVVAVVLWATHLVTDDGRPLWAFAERVKGADLQENTQLAIYVDQSAHLVALYGISFLAVALMGP